MGFCERVRNGLDVVGTDRYALFHTWPAQALVVVRSLSIVGKICLLLLMVISFRDQNVIDG